MKDCQALLRASLSMVNSPCKVRMPGPARSACTVRACSVGGPRRLVQSGSIDTQRCGAVREAAGQLGKNLPSAAVPLPDEQLTDAGATTSRSVTHHCAAHYCFMLHILPAAFPLIQLAHDIRASHAHVSLGTCMETCIEAWTPCCPCFDAANGMG